MVTAKGKRKSIRKDSFWRDVLASVIGNALWQLVVYVYLTMVVWLVVYQAVR